jgi:hypothetical protein
VALPIVCTPPILNRLFEPYRSFFSKPQFEHFRRLTTGLLVSEKKTIQEINDGFGVCDQSSLNRFVTKADFDLESLNNLRLVQVMDMLPLQGGMFIADEMLSHHTGRKMELAGMHRSGKTKRVEWGHMFVNSYFVDDAGNEFPVRTGVYVRQKDCGDREFRTKRFLALEHLDAALRVGLPVNVVNVDAGYEGVEFTRAIRARGLKFIIGVRTTTKVSKNRERRVSIKELTARTILKKAIIDEKIYEYHLETVHLRGIGRAKLVLMKHPDDDVRAYITDLETSDRTIIRFLVKRWRIESFHREGKQHVGLEAYQVRKGRGMQVVALAILTAYTLALLAARFLQLPGRALRGIGEVCRYLQLIAYKGVNWIRKMRRNTIQFIDTLNKLVYIKNAKV